MKIGFTGTRLGMTHHQQATFAWLARHSFDENEQNEWHDGDCVGADDQAHKIVTEIALGQGISIQLHGHPCDKPEYRANNLFEVDHPVKEPLIRNKDIVNWSDIIFATPAQQTELVRGSGTWATIRYTRRVGKELYLIWPNGRYTHERNREKLPL